MPASGEQYPEVPEMRMTKTAPERAVPDFVTDSEHTGNFPDGVFEAECGELPTIFHEDNNQSFSASSKSEYFECSAQSSLPVAFHSDYASWPFASPMLTYDQFCSMPAA